MKILCTAPFKNFKASQEILKKNSKVTFLEYPSYNAVSKIIHNYDGYIPNARMKIDKKLLKKAKKLKVIYQPSLGKDHIDLLACNELKIKILGLSDDKLFQKTLWSTAEFTIGLILACLKRISESSNDVTKKGNWRNTDYIGNDLSNLKVGIIGYGNIGSKVDKLLQAFDVKTFKCDPYIEQVDDSFINLDEIFEKSDLITLHVPLTKETNQFITYKSFSKMKEGFFINSSRGPVIKDQDLIKAMNKNYITAAALDVISNENVKGVKGHSLVKYSKINKRLMITPHLGGSSFEYLNKIFLHSAQRLLNELKNEI